MTSPLVKKYPTEIFGYPFTDNSVEVQQKRRSQFCPFINGECKKPRKSQPHIKVGDCSVGYKGNSADKFQPIIICPYRFNVSSVFREIENHTFKGRWVTEVSLGSAGSVDYVLFQTNEKGEVSDFVCVEFQAAGTTGTPWKALQEFRRTGQFSKDTYNYGINWANEFLKTMMQQAFKKGIIAERWNKKLIFVIQDAGMDYLKSACDTSGLREANEEDNIHFYTFSLEWNKSQWELVFREKLSTNADGIRKMLAGKLAEDHIRINEFKANILGKLGKTS